MSGYKTKVKSDYIISTFLVATSILLLFFAGKISATPTVSDDELNKQAEPLAIASCVNSLTKIGIHATTSNSEVVILEKSDRDLISLVERGSLVMQTCVGLEPKSFCAGETCLPDAGLAITLISKKV